MLVENSKKIVIKLVPQLWSTKKENLKKMGNISYKRY